MPPPVIIVQFDTIARTCPISWTTPAECSVDLHNSLELPPHGVPTLFAATWHEHNRKAGIDLPVARATVAARTT